MPHASTRRRLSTRALVGGASAVTALFVAITVYAGATFHRARRMAVEASTNMLPCMTSLVAARTDIRHLNTAMDELLLAEITHVPAADRALSGARRDLGAHLTAYAALPTDAIERAGYEQVLTAMREVDQATVRLRDLLAGGDLATAARYEGSTWRERTDALDEAVRRVLLSCGDRLQERVERLQRIARASLFIVSSGGALSLLVAMVALRRTVRRIREHQQRLEDRAGELELFSARVAHDIMSPLQMVLLALNRAREISADDLSTRLAARGQQAVGRIRQISDALLDFARAGGEAPVGEHAALPAVVETLYDELQPYADEHGVELCREPLPAVEVACSPAMLSVMVSNLVRNAIKHMGERAVRRVTVRATAEGDRVTLEVEDTGPGLAPGTEARVFEPFVRGQGAKGAGIGLGLATVKRTAEAYRGKVGVRSTPDQGALFWVTLPRAA